MWSTLKHLIYKKKNTFVPPDLTANQFNKYFIQIGQQLGAKFNIESIPKWNEHISPPCRQFHPKEFNDKCNYTYLRKLPDRSNLDLLEMDSKLLRLSAKTVSPYIAKIFNMSTSLGSIPND